MGLERKNNYVPPLLQIVKDTHTYKKGPLLNSSIIISFIKIPTKTLKNNAPLFKATSTDFKNLF